MKKEEFLKFNINNYVFVKLTDSGFIRLAELHNKYVGVIPNFKKKDAEYYKQQVDIEGYTKFQLWSFIADFGEVTGMGFKQTYCSDILFKKTNLEEL